jgi:hypothetical protein
VFCSQIVGLSRRHACLRTGAVRDPESRLGSDIGCFVFEGIHERKNRHVSGGPAVHGSMANMALGIAPLQERQSSRRHFIFGPAIGTSEDHHRFTMRQW